AAPKPKRHTGPPKPTPRNFRTSAPMSSTAPVYPCFARRWTILAQTSVPPRPPAPRWMQRLPCLAQQPSRRSPQLLCLGLKSLRPLPPSSSRTRLPRPRALLQLSPLPQLLRPASVAPFHRLPRPLWPPPQAHPKRLPNRAGIPSASSATPPAPEVLFPSPFFQAPNLSRE